MACPVNSTTYNNTLCACLPGYVSNLTSKRCTLFRANSTIITGSGVDSTLSFPETLFDFDSIKKFTQSQAVFLEATLVLLISWLMMCFFLRFTKLRDGRNVWFNVRWWISRFDICFATRHWLDDQNVVTKHKTELGGTFSIASLILFIGLFSALLYQIISKRSIEVHNVRAVNGPELASFNNDMEFNITTVSSMSCANLRGLGNLVTGTSSFFDQRVVSLSTFGSYSCHNSSKGPTVILKCTNCKLINDNMYISWQFVDLPNNPAMAVGFEFNLSATANAKKKHKSFVIGTVKDGSTFDDNPVTFRGRQSNILKFNFFPQIYHNLHDLKLVQPLFHEFLPGSFSRDTNQLQASLENSIDGLVNTTLYINFLSAYVVEINQENIMGPVSFLADLGGLYCISIGIFFFLLIQCEYRIKKLRSEDSIMQRIRNRRKAQDHWDKLRKYVMYTYGLPALDDIYSSKTDPSCGGCMLQSIHGSKSSPKPKQPSRKDSISFYKKTTLPGNKSVSCKPIRSTNDTELHSEKMENQQNVGSYKDSPQSQPQESSIVDDNFIPLPPSLDCKSGSEMDISDIEKNIRSLYEYNVMLRDRLIAEQSRLHPSSSKHSSQIKSNET